MDIPVDLEVQVDWLYEATTWGSFYASKTLEQINQEEHLLARREFHARGGYNQFFYPREPPPYIGSQEFRNSVSSLNLVGDLSHAHTLLVSAAVYGDDQLADRLLEVTGIDPNFSNEYGESLMVVACKGGNLPVVRVNTSSSFCVLYLMEFQLLAHRGATASIYDGEKVIRQPALHWLVAFDNADLVEASKILHAAHAGIGKYTDMQWSHPSVDIPGTFPRAAPLHYAIFSGRDQVVSLLLQHWPEQINYTGTDIDGRTPLEYALSVHRLNEVRVLIKNGALMTLKQTKTVS